MADLKRSIEIIFEGNDQASRKAADVLAKVKELDQSQREAGAGGDKLAKSLDDIGSKATGIGLLNSAIAALAVGQFVDRFIEANVAVEQFEKGIKAVKGSTADTGAELDYIRGVAQKYGVEVGSLTKSYTSLTAATIGSNLEGKATRDIFEAVTKAMAATGKTGDDTAGALRAIEQIAGKGKVQMEELRGQLGDRLPVALRAAATEMGVTTAQLEEMVKAGLSADVFLPKLAAGLEKTFSGASFEGYINSLARLRNAIDEAFVDLGKAGGFEILKGVLDGLTTSVQAVSAVMVGFVSTIRLVGELLANFFFSASTNDWDGFGKRAKESLDKAAAGSKDLIAVLTGAKKPAEEAAAAIGEIGGQAAARKVDIEKMGQAAAEVDGIFKKYGINPKLRADISDLTNDLTKLIQSPSANGKDFLTVFEAGLKRLRTNEDLNAVGAKLTQAFLDGKLSAEEFTIGVNDLAKAQEKVNKATGESTKGLKDNEKALRDAAKEAERAKEKAEKFRLEMEKLASNERIKAIEAKVTLDVANVVANTERVKAMLASIDGTVKDTGELLGKLFGNLSGGLLDPSARRLVEDQIAQENKRRQDALDLQKKLVNAQVENLKAQTRSLERGDALIKVDGAGLQPELEAFMWRILQTIQVRANADGQKFLLGIA